MIRLLLMLLGADLIRRHARVITRFGMGWALIGIVLFVDALDNAVYFPLSTFGFLLAAESLWTLCVAVSGLGAQRTLRLVKGAVVLAIAVLLITGSPVSHMLLSMLFGVLFLVGGVLQVVSAHVVRFAHWKTARAAGIGQILIAIFFFQPYPTHYRGTLPYALGIALMLSGWAMIQVGRRVRTLRDGDALAAMMNPGGRPDPQAGPPSPDTACAPADPIGTAPGKLTVHVWTPVGSSRSRTLNRPVIERYIAAVDADGVISTGHAALEATPDLYISLYPAVEIDRSPADFARLLRATADNDIGGIYQPDYATESRAWCPSTDRIVFTDYDPVRLRAFWSDYRRTPIYNLTNRNCSSTVAAALEAALEGVLGLGKANWGRRAEVLLTPELWVAAEIRKRATTMAWTPGLTLDYARALRAIVHPRELPWLTRVRAAWRLRD